MAHRHPITAVLIVIGFLLLTASACGSPNTFGLFNKPDQQIPFDVAGWNAPMTDPDGLFTGTRLKMVDDLLQRYDFHGWTVDEVKELLGEPLVDEAEEQGHVVTYDLRDGLKLLIFEIDACRPTPLPRSQSAPKLVM
jgi:hypothetical protein